MPLLFAAIKQKVKLGGLAGTKNFLWLVPPL